MVPPRSVPRTRTDGPGLSPRSALSLLSSSAAFRSSLASTLRSSPFQNFFFETPPATEDNIDDMDFEFVLVETRPFGPVDKDTFREHFR